MENAAKVCGSPAHAVSTVPGGAWAVGVSGGADSVALLALLRNRADLALRVVHLDHETRGGASAEDAAFVSRLAAEWRLPITVRRISQVEGPNAAPIKNLSDRYRQARLVLFASEVNAHGLLGVILAHHREDQAETIMARLLRGAGAIGLAGMRQHSRVAGLTILHPLLDVSRDDLRAELQRRGLTWREDISNRSPVYLRNRVRRLLDQTPPLREALLDLGSRCRTLREALDAGAPDLGERLAIRVIRELDPPLARHAARRWLIQQGARAQALNNASIDRLLLMATDAASPARIQFAGGLLVRRRAGEIFVNRP